MATIYLGVDVSEAQGTINWTTMAANVNFVIIRAGYNGTDAGVNREDAQFVTNQAGARAHNIPRAYYWYADNTLGDPFGSAVTFQAVVGTLQPGEFLVLDWDPPANGDAWCFTFCNALKTGTGLNPLIYMDYYAAHSSGSWGSTSSITHLWLAAPWVPSSSDFSESVPSWGFESPNYRILQYGLGTGSTYGAGSSQIDLDSFYSPNNTMNDFTAYGHQNTTPTVSTTATTPSFSNYTQARPLAIAIPKDNLDKVIYSKTLGFSVSGSGTQTFASGIGQTAYPVGIYSIDAGATWRDLGATDSGYFLPGSYFPPVSMTPTIATDGTISLAYKVNDGNNYSVIVKIALLASSNPSPLSTVNASNQTLAFNSALQATNYSNYRRIAIDTTQSPGGSDFTLTSVPHHLSSVPTPMFWAINNDGSIKILPDVFSSRGGIGSIYSMVMDDTNIYFEQATSPSFAQYAYRVYVDN